MKPGEFSEEFVQKLARHAYEHGSANFDFTASECALLVIDMQDEFVKPHWTPFWVPDATRIAPRIAKLIEHCRSASIPVIYTAFAETHNFLDRPFTGSFMPNRFPEAGEHDGFFKKEVEIWHELPPLPGELVIYKPSYGAFYDTPLQTILHNLGKTTVIISGILTNFCCGTTARQAYERGFKVVFGADVTATDDPELHEAELKVLRKGFAKVMTLEEIVASTSTAETVWSAES